MLRQLTQRFMIAKGNDLFDVKNNDQIVGRFANFTYIHNVIFAATPDDKFVRVDGLADEADVLIELTFDHVEKILAALTPNDMQTFHNLIQEIRTQMFFGATVYYWSYTTELTTAN